MPAALNTHVHVIDSDGAAHVFGPGDEVPRWAHSLITTPKAWAEAPDLAPEPTPHPPAKKTTARARKAAADGDLQSG